MEEDPMRSVFTVMVALVLLTWIQLPLDACGDKFLLVGRGASYVRVFASVYPGSIAIYTRDSARAAERTAGLRKVLTHAGHRVSVVSGNNLIDMLQRGRTDIVIADGINAPTIDPQLSSFPSQPTVLYVLMDRDGHRTGGAGAGYRLKQSDKALRWLQVIESEMQARAQSGTRVKS
jgi:hypothetical protein